MNALKSFKAPVATLISSRFLATRALSSSAVIANARAGLKQSSNRDATWSENQIEKSHAFKGPRFENTDIQAQVTTLNLD